jgi:hypothetical protein
MKTNGFLFAAISVAITVSLSACSASKISVREAEQFQGTAVMHYPMIAKKEIKAEKINHTYTDSQCSIGKSCEILAYNDALKTLKIDGIFEPIYHHNKVSFRSATITVTGYPYIYTEFREVTKEDKELLASPGSTWIPIQTDNRPYITNDTQATLWMTILYWTLGITGTSLLLTALLSG